MTTLQEYLNKKYPTKEERGRVKRVDFWEVERELKKQNITLEPVKEIDLSDYVGLTHLNFTYNQLTNVDFLNTIPNPKKLMYLIIFNNKIQPTDIKIFSRFKNIETLKIGTIESSLKKGRHNQFYGSFESWKDLSKLYNICIEATDVDRGLEYLPMSLAEATKGRRYDSIECSPHNTNAKCQAIQNELRPFNYDLEAWQLSHPEKMLIARPELFTNSDSKDKWLNALKDKIINTQQELNTAKATEQDKTAKIARLETKIQELELAKSTVSQQTQTDFSTQNKGTQTNLTASQITNLEQQNEQLLKLLQATETELNNTKKQLEQLQDKDEEATEQIKQLESKIKLLELQKENYQTKYDKSIEFIKEIREDVKNF